nr:uncharacterized protein LOC110800052 [Spinacia oleracea]
MGDKKIKGKDYKHTFSPVARFTTVRTIMALVAAHNWHLHQLDINNALLHGFIDEEIYMKSPPGYKKAPPGKDCSMFTRENGKDFTIVVAYVDDLLVTGSNILFIEEVKRTLDNKFTIKDLGELKYFLGIEVTRTDKGILLNQRKYILDLLKTCNMENNNIAPFPLPKGLKLSTMEGPLITDPEIYRIIVGKLLYLNMTRPDISYAVQQLTQFLNEPRTPHLSAALHVLKYLKGTLNYGLFYYANTDLKLTACSDVDWGTCACSARSLTGYCIFLGDPLISWKTKKHKVVSKSSTEAEYRSMSQTTSEVVWIDGLLQDLKVNVPKPIQLFCDNKSGQYIAENEIFQERTKHLKIDCHYVLDPVTDNFLILSHVSSSLQLADIMTKPLGAEHHNFLSSKIGLNAT